MGKFNSINDAVRAKIDKLIEEKGLDKKDYLYTADVASSLNQLASIMGGSGNSMTIADSLYDVLDSADGAGGGSSSGPVIEWIQLAKPEDVFTYSTYQHVLSLDASSFGWENGSALVDEMKTWFFVKRQYNGETKYNSTLAVVNGSNGSFCFYAATNNATYEQVMLQLQYDEDPSTGYQIQSLELSISGLPSDITSGISIYVGKATSSLSFTPPAMTA